MPKLILPKKIWLAARAVYQKYGTQILIQGLIYAWDSIFKTKKPK